MERINLTASRTRFGLSQREVYLKLVALKDEGLWDVHAGLVDYHRLLSQQGEQWAYTREAEVERVAAIFHGTVVGDQKTRMRELTAEGGTDRLLAHLSDLSLGEAGQSRAELCRSMRSVDKARGGLMRNLEEERTRLADSEEWKSWKQVDSEIKKLSENRLAGFKCVENEVVQITGLPVEGRAVGEGRVPGPGTITDVEVTDPVSSR